MRETLHIYTRVSSAVQAEGTSLHTQKEIGISLAHRLDMDYEVHNEGGKSSANDDLQNRPVMLELLKMMDRGRIKHLFVYNTDRLSRNQITWYTIRQKMVANGVKLYTPKGIHDSTDSMENMILGIMNEIAVYDNKTRSDRSRIGKFQKVKMNFWRGGPPPFGYAIEKVEGGSKLVINPEESKWVRFIFKSYVDRVSLKDIKKELDNSKVKTRRQNDTWSLGSLQAMIKNKLYTGIEEYHDKKMNETIVSKIPQIISDTVFRQVQERRELILARKGQLGKTTKLYLLRDFMVCDSCGTPMGGRRKAESNYKAIYYCPLSERNFKKRVNDTKVCTMSHAMHIDATDAEIWTMVQNVITDSASIKRELEKSNLLGAGLTANQIKKQRKSLQQSLSVLHETKAKLEKGLIQIETQNTIGGFDSPEIYKGAKRSLSSQYSEVKSQIEGLEAQIDQLGNHQAWFDWIDQFGLEFAQAKDLSDVEKKALLTGVIRSLKVSYNSYDKLHTAKVNFKLPVLVSVRELLERCEIDRMNCSLPKTTGTPVNTGLPEKSKWDLLHSNGFGSNVFYSNGNHYYLTLCVEYSSATLWSSHYSDYQKQLYDMICDMRSYGMTFAQISDHFNAIGYLTPRGYAFQATHVWSILNNKQQSMKRFSRSYSPNIKNIGIDLRL
jgi:DNA invertase Pin-like site-specific DNA recombinase